MQHTKARNSYKSIATETASPGKLILMLYDGGLGFLKTAESGFLEETNSRRNEVINYNLNRAAQIVVELRAALDLSVEGEFPRTMYALYTYMEELIGKANMKKEVEPIYEVKKYLTEIRDAWAEMLKNQETSAVATARIACSV